MEVLNEDYQSRRRFRRMLFGILLVGAGVLLVLSNLGIFPPYLHHIIFSWQMLLIAIGVVNILSGHNYFSGIILVSIGGFFLVPEVWYFPFDFDRLFWPLLLIGVGVMIILRPKRNFRRCGRHHRHHEFDTYQNSSIENGVVNESNVFGGNKRLISPCVFKGGRIDNVFGGTELDLTQTTLGDGENILDIRCVFGGVVIIVPSDWNVKVEITSIMGGFNDKRRLIRNAEINLDKILIIRGETIFGGGEIKSY